jgi:hypothetical protein
MLGGDNALWCADGFGMPTSWSWYSLGGAFVPSETDPYVPNRPAATPPISVAADQNTVLVFAIDAAGVAWANRAESLIFRGYLILSWGGWQSLGIAP